MQRVPRLILQPIVENAVEHDITPNRGGKLTLRACQTEQEVTLEVFHEGTMTEKDRENIRRICSDAPLEKRRVGLRNVYKRMKLLYGDRGGLTVDDFVAFPYGRSVVEGAGTTESTRDKFYSGM